MGANAKPGVKRESTRQSRNIIGGVKRNKYTEDTSLAYYIVIEV
jgi:hypothetical protein